MSDWIGLAFIGLVLLAGILGLAHLSKPYKVTPEEFEKRVKESPGLLSAGVMGLQKLLDPAAGKAMEVQEDFKQGHYNAGQDVGDGEKAGDFDEETGKTEATGRTDKTDQKMES